jgi:hypothetical protein
MRGAPSAADRILMEVLAAENLQVSASQLERWRHRGLLPKPRVVHRGRGLGSAVIDHSTEVLEAAALLAEVSKRGVPWQTLGNALFHWGYPLRQDCLQGCARRLGDGVQQKMRAAWLDASSTTASLGSRDDQFEDVAAAAAECFITRRSCRTLWAETIATVRAALPDSPADEIVNQAKASLGIRIADAAGAGPLSVEQLRIARYFSEHQDSRIARQPLISERQVCAATLTTSEAYCIRDIYERGAIDVGARSLLDQVVWDVTIERLAVESELGSPPRADQPLSAEALESVRAEYASVAQMAVD